uniref:Zinc finger, CCHC-type n=1 Tax=Tanacetum cinerariifolium TaxID=118510 RepID=A0A699GQS6_TANCI|nr:zinc finger, CCHC-type [Tanacetum cinerariifolium]
MENENPRRTLGDYSKPSNEGYRNTIEIPNGNNMVPFRSDTIRTSKLCNDILLFQQHQGESLSEAWTRFKDLLQKVPRHGIDLWLQILIFYNHVNPITRRTIDQAASDVPSTSDRRLIKLKNQVQHLMKAHLAPNQPLQVNKIASSCEICSGPHDTQICMENLKQAFVEYASSRTKEARGRGFLATANAVIDCKKAKLAVEEGLTRSIFSVRELDFGEGNVPYWTTIGKSESYKPRTSEDGIGTIPINLKRNMWESEEVIDNKMDWDRPPKKGDGVWHTRIELIDPGGEKFDRTFQSIPTSRKLSLK